MAVRSALGSARDQATDGINRIIPSQFRTPCQPAAQRDQGQGCDCGTGYADELFFRGGRGGDSFPKSCIHTSPPTLSVSVYVRLSCFTTISAISVASRTPG